VMWWPGGLDWWGRVQGVCLALVAVVGLLLLLGAYLYRRW
jgi:hypothetical protein